MSSTTAAIPVVGVENPMSVPSYVNTSPLDAPEVNPGILNEVTLASPSVISFVAVAAEGSALYPKTVKLLPDVIVLPADCPTAVLL